MRYFGSIGKKGVAWPYIVGLVLGIAVLLFILYYTFKGRGVIYELFELINGGI